MFVGVAVTIVIIAGASLYLFLRQGSPSDAKGQAVPNPDCSLLVPADPLSAQGLATPYQLVATNPKNGPCHEANPDQGAFVEASVIDPATGKVSVYSPLVIDINSKPAIAPVVPQLPNGAIVGIWFGYQGDNLTLRGAGVKAGNCVNGINGSIFGQVAFCNATAFFQAANQAIKDGKLVPPPLGMGKDGKPCPSVRDFTAVDQDQSDNVTTIYLVTAKGQIAQMSAANVAQMPDALPMKNGSDNGLVSRVLDGALGCQPWKVSDLADAGGMVTSQALLELQAAAHQTAPIAVVPAGDPMVLLNGKLNLNKLNAYRLGVDQPVLQSLADASTKTYCQNMLAAAPQRYLLDAPLTLTKPSPDPAAANNLFTFLAQRFVAAFDTELNCTGLLKVKDPIKVKTDKNGVAISATINGIDPGNGKAPVGCIVDGTLVAACTGTVTINGQTCSLRLDTVANNVVIDCAAKQP
jgi:hypothetical protein